MLKEAIIRKNFTANNTCPINYYLYRLHNQQYKTHTLHEDTTYNIVRTTQGYAKQVYKNRLKLYAKESSPHIPGRTFCIPDNINNNTRLAQYIRANKNIYLATNKEDIENYNM